VVVRIVSELFQAAQPLTSHVRVRAEVCELGWRPSRSIRLFFEPCKPAIRRPPCGNDFA
jgi:hypothetical protein